MTMRGALSLTLPILALAGCNLTPASALAGAAQAAQGFFISDDQEVQIGQQTMAQIFQETPEYTNATVHDYVTRVGQKMVAQSERSTLAFQFHVLDSTEINAFAAPGGFVFVTTGALRLMTNEAQLAGVVGHEVGHVAKRHSIQGIQQQLAAQGLATAVLGQNANQIVSAGANIAQTLVLKGFDRGKEEEADRLGAQYSYQAGYDCRELGGFLDALGKQVGDTPVWLLPVADHPRSDDRVKLLADFITTQKYAPAGKTTDEADFKTNVLDNLGAATTASPTPAPTATPAG